MSRSCLVMVAVIAWLAPARAARAHEEFPYLMAAELHAQQNPPCSVCHVGGKISGATVFTLFAWSMRAHGLSGAGDSVAPAVHALDVDGVDSDGDGVSDADEIRRGTNPNAPGNATSITDPQLGCQVAAGAPGGGAAALLVGALLWLIRRTRRPAARRR